MMSVALKARARHTRLPENDARDQNAVTAYGLLYIRGRGDEQSGINRTQLHAADYYLETMTWIYRIKGWSMPHLRSSAASMVSAGGTSLSIDPSEETISVATQTYRQICDALWEAGRENVATTKGIPDANACRAIVHSICFLMDRDIITHRLSHEELGNLRVGLNNIHRRLLKG